MNKRKYKKKNKAFLARISEPLIDRPIFTEEQEDCLLKVVIQHWLERGGITQKQILAEDAEKGTNVAEFIERFGLQHLVAGGWTPVSRKQKLRVRRRRIRTCKNRLRLYRSRFFSLFPVVAIRGKKRLGFYRRRFYRGHFEDLGE